MVRDFLTWSKKTTAMPSRKNKVGDDEPTLGVALGQLSKQGVTNSGASFVHSHGIPSHQLSKYSTPKRAMPSVHWIKPTSKSRKVAQVRSIFQSLYQSVSRSR